MNIRLIKCKLLSDTHAKSAFHQACHDLRISGHIPTYIDTTKSHENFIIVNELFQHNDDVDSKQYEIAIFDVLQREMEDGKKCYERKSKQRYQDATAPFIIGVITFFNEEKKFLSDMHRISIITAIDAYITRFATRHNIRLLYAVVHFDEKTLHVHFMLTAMNKLLGKTVKMDRAFLSQQQTDLNAHMSRSTHLQFQRGEKNSANTHTTRAEYVDALERDNARFIAELRLLREMQRQYEEDKKKKEAEIAALLSALHALKKKLKYKDHDKQ